MPQGDPPELRRTPSQGPGMTPERWVQVRNIFESAMELRPGERAAFLDRECADDATLRAEVDGLLSAEGKVQREFLEGAPAGQAGFAMTMTSTMVSVGTRLGPYEIQALLGAGGMGEVYRARDTRLNRTVAIKVLPPSLSSDPFRRKRFEREARAISALQHPNICTLFDVGRQDDTDYLVMEYLDGETLAARLRKGSLPLDLALKYSIEIADALAAAHGRGVVHRDLKPGNIFLTAHGESKVLDFGLAKLEEPDPDSDTSAKTGAVMEMITTPGVAMGTAPYMSPEQARGEELDSRTDIFSLGAVLYETATGRMPFQGKTIAIVHKAILDENPTPPSALVPALPSRFDEVIAKALEKDRELRYQGAADLRTDLEGLRLTSGERISGQAAGWERTSRPSEIKPGGEKRRWPGIFTSTVLVGAAVLLMGVFGLTAYERGWQVLFGGAAHTRLGSLAVLPFQNLSGDPAQAYFVDGITDELTTNLAQISDLRVPARTSTMQFKDTQAPVSQVAKQLNVEAVLEGSITRSGQHVRITAQLIEASRGFHIWAKTYERESNDIMVLQDELAHDIAAEVRVNLDPETKKRLSPAHVPTPKAYDAYLRGRYLWARRTEEDLLKARDYFQQAISEDPEFAAGFSGLADTYFYLSYAWGHIPPKEGMPLAKAAALKAIQLDGSGAEGHVSLALVDLFYEWDLAAAEQQFKQAIALNPSNELSHHGYSVLLTVENRDEEAVAQARKAVEVDPLSIPAANILAGSLARVGHCNEATAEVHRAFDLDPNPLHVALLRNWLRFCLNAEGKTQEAFEEELKMRAARGMGTAELEDLRKIYARSGMKGIWAKDLEADLKKWDKDHYHADANAIAFTYAYLGNFDQAFAWVDKEIELRSTVLIWIFAVESPFYGQPRLEGVKRKMAMRF